MLRSVASVVAQRVVVSRHGGAPRLCLGNLQCSKPSSQDVCPACHVLRRAGLRGNVRAAKIWPAPRLFVTFFLKFLLC